MIAAPEAELKKETFSDFENMSVTAKQYTPFWPVFIVFFFFVITAVLQLVSNLEAKKNLQASVALLTKGVERAKAKNDTLNGLAHDLIQLAPTSAPAQQIVNDFRIQVKNGAPRSNAPANAAAPTPAAPTTAPK